MRSVRLSSTALVWLGGLFLIVGSWYLLRSAEAQTTAPAVAGSVPGHFELAYAQLYDKDLCETVMYHTATGQAWHRVGVSWKKIAEPTPLPPGRYRVELVPSRQDGYRTFRYSQLTGQCWYIKDLKWVAFEALEK